MHALWVHQDRLPEWRAMKNLSLKNRLSPTVVGLLCGAAFAALPGVASAQLAESWENGVDNAKWKASTEETTTYNTTGANPITTRSSITTSEAECAGTYVRETVQSVAGRVFAAGANVQAVTAGNQYCMSAWIRAAAGSNPYLGLQYTGATGIAEFGAKGDAECYMASNGTFVGNACAAGHTLTAINTDGAWRWVSKTFTVPAGRTHAVTKFMTFCGNSTCPADGTGPAVDFDDVRLTAGACPATPPANTAPHTACAGTTPVCVPGNATDNAKCAACTGNAGAAAPAVACPAATPVCQTAGTDKGACKTSCTGNFGADAGAGACAETSPFCVDIATTAFKECKPCNGNAGSAAAQACPNASPTCFTTGAKAGSCGRCVTNADCGGTTPRCDTGTGTCTDDCENDVDCGDKKSGKICTPNAMGQTKCTDGCRGDTAVGNGCPDGQKCSSVDLKAGTCTPEATDAGADTGPGPGPNPEPTDSGVTPTPEVDSGTGEPTTPTDEGGCSMSPRSAGGGATALLGVGLAIAALGRRRRS